MIEGFIIVDGDIINTLSVTTICHYDKNVTICFEGEQEWERKFETDAEAVKLMQEITAAIFGHEPPLKQTDNFYKP